ncbi:unnamed protein product [Acanthoscelides obtectus]|uniref:Uncharacterized protein n=1 Tax=Acanthoscelides obtectus TaxID=200917 RepID=A0A9P0KBX3_ACAOB|nr:unnamed protein product [Acanthoscelides obtectus]CAK1646756.1 hypothetical protein AOBTE_LOCUS14854 [Acanthoscelides obtectus]
MKKQQYYLVGVVNVQKIHTDMIEDKFKQTSNPDVDQSQTIPTSVKHLEDNKVSLNQTDFPGNEHHWKVGAFNKQPDCNAAGGYNCMSKGLLMALATSVCNPVTDTANYKDELQHLDCGKGAYLQI